ncbi:uncharacterized protein BYT42DRAFT_543635 [Radiomyces spectabilis]|uniref:uncharacterized protein n=1 Tax=Radiomyces spectabilis TaxID=64574 RepID=UPI00221F7804|nr:uncharacterized protein BYT42DRAFT_543635 [Radiomyces spectabilis]KAI8388312.1 hypothetical protein BYT42DRAFT_543635 [Radiomyces spectabilis]
MDDELDFENLDYGDLGDFNPDDFDEEALERELGLITESVNKKEVAAKPAVSQASSEPKAISKPSEAKAEPTKTDTREAAKETSSSANVGAKPSTTPPKATEPTTKPTSTVEPAKPTVAAAKPTVAAKADDKQSPSNVKGAVEEDTEKLKPKETRPTTPQARRSPYPRMQSGHGNYSQRNYMSQDMYAMGQQGYMMGMKYVSGLS